VETYQPGKDKVKAMNTDEVKLFLQVAKRSQAEGFHNATVILLNGWLRRNELMQLKRDDVDLRNKTIVVRGKKTRGREHPYRTIALNSAAYNAILNQLDHSDGDRLFPHSYSWLYRNVKKALKKSGLDMKFSGVHFLRHTGASLALMNGEPLFTVSKILGHTSTDFTARVYGHLLPGALAEALERNVINAG
jgi:integrase